VLKPLELAREAIYERAAIQKDQELAGFIAMVMDLEPLKTVVEVGAFAGGTMWAWGQLGARVIGVDLPPHGFPNGPQVNDMGMTVICGDSHDPATMELLLEELDGDPIDMLFIDGDHTYEGVKADYELYAPLVRTDGIIGFHDICPHRNMPFIEVDRFWLTLHGEKDNIICHPPTWGGIGVIRAGDPAEIARLRAEQLDLYQQAQSKIYVDTTTRFQRAR